MRTSALLAVAAIGAATLTGCDRPAAPKSPGGGGGEKAAAPDARPSTALLGHATATPEFISRVMANDRFEIDTGKLALARSTNNDIREFSAGMIAAHTETTDELKHAMADARIGMTAPAALTPELQSRLDGLAKVNAADFEKRYIEIQIDAHQATLDLLQRYARDGDVAQLKRFAADNAPAVQEQLSVARSIKAVLR